MFQVMITPILQSARLCYSLWYNAPTTLSAGSLEAEAEASASRLPAGNIVGALYYKL